MNIMDRMNRWLFEPEPPGLGLELRAGEMSVVGIPARGKRVLEFCMTAPIPTGLLNFSMSQPNILDRQKLVQLVTKAIDQAGVSQKRLALTLPDSICRVSVQQIPEAPSGSEELAEMLRFRLKKALPFPSEQARIAFERIEDGSDNPSFLTGVMHEDVISEYEDFLSSFGFEVGIVLPSTFSVLNLLAPIAAEETGGSDYFFVNAEQDYFSLTLVRNGLPTLSRTLGMREAGDSGKYQTDDLEQELIPTVLYYQQKLGGQLNRVYYRSLRRDLPNLASVLSEQFEAPAHAFDLFQSIEIGKKLELDSNLADTISGAAGGAFGHAA